MFERFVENPLITPDDLPPTRDDFEVLCTLNPAAVRFGDEIILLVRVGEKPPDEGKWLSAAYYDAASDEVKIKRIQRDDPQLDTSDPRKYFYGDKVLLTSLSHLRVARSRDGVNFTFEEQPAIFPATPYEAFGCEDARITFIDGKYYITYTAVSDRGITVGLASTEDFRTFRRHGLIFPPYQKDVCIFPEKVGGMYVCRHRPYMSEFNPAAIWTAYSPDIFSWGRHEMTHSPVVGTWQSVRIGCGPPPVKTDKGWLEIYHASDDNGRYCLGAMLSEGENPHRVISCSSRPVFEPAEDYEMNGVYGRCVFSNGLVADEDGKLTVYYGAADTVCAGAITAVDDMLTAAKS